MGLLKVSDIQKTEDGRLILDNISFSQRAGQKIGISGESGAGKTTLLKIIGGLTQPDIGEIFFEGKRVEGPLEKLIPGHRHIAYHSQHFELRNHYRVEELLDMSNQLHDAKARNIYRVCRIDHLLKRWTSQLSGGEKQRISLAMLIGSSPKLLLLDEPFSNLDPIHKNILRSVINDVADQLQITCLLTSHDPNDTLSWADEIIVMKSGRIIQQAPPEIIYQYPVDDYVAGMFGVYMTINRELISSFPRLAILSKKYLRPENFRIDDKEQSSQLTVTNIRYMGSHYEIEAKVFDSTITLRSKRSFGMGDVIGVSIEI